jgi:hypothetical protein
MRRPSNRATLAPAAMTDNAAAADAAAHDAACRSRNESAAVAEQIGLAALALAKEANSAGLTTLGFLLESAALEAGAEAAASRWPAEIAES